MKVIVTGVTGFVGQNLKRFLEDEKHQVDGLSLRNDRWMNEFPISGEALIHLAGKAHDTKNTSSPEEYFTINRDLTIAVFDKFLQSDIRDFFFFSSVKAVADSIDGVLNETATAKPLTPYGQSKMEAEQYLLQQPLPAGKRLFIIRPCMIHGPGNKGNLNLLYSLVKKGTPWPLAAFHNLRSFLSIDNLNFLVHQMLITKDLPSGVYQMADDELLSTNDLINLMSNVLGKKTKLWKIPKSLITRGAKIGDVLPVPLNSERLKKLTESYIVSNTKIKSALGIEKLPLTAKKGLEKTIRSFSDNG